MIEIDRDGISELNVAQMLDGLNDFAKKVHQNAEDHGWWTGKRKLPEILMLCVSELAEALETYRSGKAELYNNGNQEDGTANMKNSSADGATSGEGMRFMGGAPVDCIYKEERG